MRKLLEHGGTKDSGCPGLGINTRRPRETVLLHTCNPPVRQQYIRHYHRLGTKSEKGQEAFTSKGSE